MTPTPIILDCDPGHDDAIALLLALASPEVELVGVTTVAGNQTLDKTTANALRVLEFAGRSDIPVFAGADRPFLRAQDVAAHVHGESGLDGPDLPPPSNEPGAQHAVDFIAEQIRARNGKLTLVPTGPLTNIGLLCALHPDVRIADVIHLGAEPRMGLEPGAVGQINHRGRDIVNRGLAIVGRRAAEHRVLASCLDDASGHAGVGRCVGQQRILRRLLAPQLFNHGLPVAGSDRHHGGLGALGHVADGSARRLRRGLGIDRLGFDRFGIRLLRRRYVQRELSRLRLRAFHEPGRSSGLRRVDRRRCIRQPACLDGPGRFALRRCRGKPFIEHKRSRDVLRRGNQRGPIRQRRKDLVEVRPRRPRRDDGGTRDGGRLERGAAHGRVDTGAENVGVDGPGAAQHEARNRDAAKEIVRKDTTGRLPTAFTRGITRTLTHTHTHAAQNSSTKSLFDAAPKKFQGPFRRGMERH